jgi:hypothetical protein
VWRIGQTERAHGIVGSTLARDLGIVGPKVGESTDKSDGT